MTAMQKVVAVVGWAVICGIGLYVAVAEWWRARRHRPAEPDPVDQHAATVPVDDEDTVPIPLDADPVAEQTDALLDEIATYLEEQTR